MDVQINNIVKSFKKQKVLDQINVTIKDKRIFCLLGASGSGKTTLLRIIMGAVSADSGNVVVDHVTIPNRHLLSLIGYMPQNDALYQDLSVWENIKFFSGLHKMARENFTKSANELLTITDMTSYQNKLIRECSGGMKKRVSLIIALIHHPKLLLLDEPTVGVDPILRRKIWNYLKSLQKNGTTILITTHVMDEVYQCDDAALIRNGKIVAWDTVEKLIKSTKNGNIEEIFFMNL